MSDSSTDELRALRRSIEHERRRTRLALLGCVIITASAPLIAAAVSLPTPEPSPGDPIVASAVWANFESLAEAVTAIEEQAPPPHVDTYSNDAIICGLSAPVNGDINALYGEAISGYEAAKALCVETCGDNPAAHMCTSDEVVRTISLGLHPVVGEDAWVATGHTGSNTIESMRDCLGFTSTSEAGSTFQWATTNPRPISHDCTDSIPVACCS